MKKGRDRILISGYSSGIGEAFYNLPEIRRNFSFLLVGRQKPRRMRKDDDFVRWDFEEVKPSSEPTPRVEKLKALVLHHGFLAGKDFRQITETEMLRTINVNLLSAVRILQAYVSFLEKGSSVIFYSSVSASKGSYDDIYALSKGGLEAFANSLSQKLGPLGVRVICIAPGLVAETRMTNELKPGLFTSTLKRIPLGAPVDKFAIARFARDLLVNENLSISGSVIHVNGGQYVE